MSQRKEYRQILIELMCIDQQSKKTSIYVTKKGIQTDFNRTHVYRPTI
jgi:hypothetical protein